MSNVCDITALANVGVQSLQPYQPGKPTEELERELGLTSIVKLASNECPLGPSTAVKEAISAVAAELNRYPDANGFQLKQCLTQFLDCDAEQITLGNGSNDVLELVVRAFVAPGEEVVYSQHAFAVYALVAQAVGAKRVEVPALNWGHHLQAMRAAITKKTKVVFIANPNNPTGTYVGYPAICEFLQSVPQQTVVVVDEAYFEYVQESDYATCIPLVEQYPNLLVTRTFSKAYGLAGLRMGYGVSQPALADMMNRIRQPFNVNRLALVAARAALMDQAHLDEAVAINRAGLVTLATFFNEMGYPFIPSVGNFISVEVGDAARIYQALLREGVIVRPIANYELPNHLRVTVGTKPELETFIAAFSKVVSQ